MNSKKIRVLVILPELNLGGGIENYAMSYYRKLRDKVDFYFITHSIVSDDYKKEIESNGEKVTLMSHISGKNILKNIKEISEFFADNHEFDIVHCHMANAAFIYLKLAKKYNIKVRIIHSHQNKYADKKIHELRNIPLVKIGTKFSTHIMACSKEAGFFLAKNGKYDLVKNAIEAKRYAFNEIIRQEYRKKFGWNDKYIIANVARMVPVKNQEFLLDVYSVIKDIEKNSKLIIIGCGELKEVLQRKIKNLKLEENVEIIEKTNKINEYMQAFDVFVLPSLYEGVGIVNIEAQAAGLHTIVSDRVPEEAKIDDNLIDFLPLEIGKEKWAEKILQYNNNYKRESIIDKVNEKGYNIDKSADNLYELYLEYMKESK